MVLGEEVGWVDLPLHIAQINVAGSRALLHPQCVGLHKPELPASGPTADVHVRRAVRPNTGLER